MAELVARHMESMIEEIQEMRRLRLYSNYDTQEILKKRKFYENKINGLVKNEQDFKDYIHFEQELLKNIKLRRNKLRIADRTSSIEVRIMKRIKHLFEIAIQRFSNDFDLSLTYFQFCKESNYTQSASLVIQNMIKNFSHIPQAWQVAASWFMKKDLKQSLSFIHKGLMHHPCSRELYIQAIELELLTRDSENSSEDIEKTDAQEKICYEKIETYVDTMFQNINNYNCLVAVLDTLEPHSFTTNIRYKIVEKLMTQYYNEEQVWQILAEREKNGQHYPAVEKQTNSAKFRLTRCFEKFEEGISKISPRKQTTMWTLYLDFLIDLNQQQSVSVTFIRETLIKKLTEAKDMEILSEKYFVIWAKLLTNETEILQVVEDGLKVLPQSVDLWKLKLRCMVMKDDVSKMNREFKKGYLALKEKSGPLWAIIIRYHILSSSNQIIETVFTDAIKQPKEIANLFKPDYIEWITLNKDIESAREVYKNLAKTLPFCKELHTKMYKLETYELNINVKELELPMKLACEQFGSEDADVWINLRDTYYEYCNLFEAADDTFNINIKRAQIKKQAEEALKDNVLMLADFRYKFDTPVNIAS